MVRLDAYDSEARLACLVWLFGTEREIPYDTPPTR